MLLVTLTNSATKLQKLKFTVLFICCGFIWTATVKSLINIFIQLRVFYLFKNSTMYNSHHVKQEEIDIGIVKMEEEDPLADDLTAKKSEHKIEEVLIDCSNDIKLERFENEDALQPDVLTCTYCGVSFGIKTYFDSHTKFCQSRHNSYIKSSCKIETVEEKRHKCLECKYETDNSGNLKKHMLTHSKERPYKCDQCNYGATQKAALQVHIRHKHTKEFPFECDLCDYKSAHSGNLKKHKLVHLSVKLFVCNVCNKNCSDLRRHKLLHLSEKPFVCDICNKSFNRSSQLQQHMYNHNGQEKPFRCDQCDYATAHASALNRHKRQKHSTVRPFACGICKYKFLSPGDLRRHLCTHSDTKPFQCMDCPYQCVRSDRLKEHIDKNHKLNIC